ERDRANREAEVSRQVKDFLTGLFQVSNPNEARGNSITAREILDKGAKQIDTALQNQPEVQAQLMQTIGRVYWNLGLYGQAAPLLERAISTQSRLLGTEHPDTLSSIGALGVVYSLQDRLGEADKLLREAFAGLRRTLGPEHPYTLSAMYNLAQNCMSEKLYQESAELYRDVLGGQRRVLGPEHPNTLSAMTGLSLAYTRLHRCREPESLCGE